MSASSTAARGRAFAERQYESTCLIAPKGTAPVTDNTTGAVTFPPGAAVYTGKCRVRPAGGQGSTAESGGAEVFVYDYLVSIPFAEADVVEGMRVTIDSSPDPALLTVVVEVTKVDRGDNLTARRLFCNEVS